MEIPKPTLQESIRAIQRNTDLSPAERGRAIAELMSSQTRAAADALSAEEAAVRARGSASTCDHYKTKKCGNLKFSCCSDYFACMRCHREAVKDHQPVVESIECISCLTRQAPSASCASCGIQFSNSHCNICMLWTDAIITHCEPCGICRVGTGNEHCFSCDACFTAGQHLSCSGRSMKEQKCAYCLTNVHDSQIPAFAQKCGHSVHSQCYNVAVRNINFDGRCPTCRRLVLDLDWTTLRHSIEIQPMPMSYDASDHPKLDVGDIVDCPELLFRTPSPESVLFVVEEVLNNEDATYRYRGKLIYRDMSPDQRQPRVFMDNMFVHESHFHPDNFRFKYVLISCQECSRRSLSDYHFLGSECLHCDTFNTSVETLTV